jgi:Ring finger domain
MLRGKLCFQESLAFIFYSYIRMSSRRNSSSGRSGDNSSNNEGRRRSVSRNRRSRSGSGRNSMLDADEASFIANIAPGLLRIGLFPRTGGFDDGTGLLHQFLQSYVPRDKPTDSKVLESLPVAVITEAVVSSQKECSVCLEKLVLMEANILTLPCDHLFHKACIVTWLEKHTTCPVCRFELPAAESPGNTAPPSTNGGPTPPFRMFSVHPIFVGLESLFFEQISRSMPFPFQNSRSESSRRSQRASSGSLDGEAEQREDSNPFRPMSQFFPGQEGNGAFLGAFHLSGPFPRNERSTTSDNEEEADNQRRPSFTFRPRRGTSFAVDIDVEIDGNNSIDSDSDIVGDGDADLYASDDSADNRHLDRMRWISLQELTLAQLQQEAERLSITIPPTLASNKDWLVEEVGKKLGLRPPAPGGFNGSSMPAPAPSVQEGQRSSRMSSSREEPIEVSSNDQSSDEDDVEEISRPTNATSSRIGKRKRN